MNKMREYERGREDGLDLALRIVRQGGMEALEKEVKFRNITGVHTSLAVKDLDKASEQIKAMTLDTFTILSVAVLHDYFGFGQIRCQRYMDGMKVLAVMYQAWLWSLSFLVWKISRRSRPDITAKA